MPRTAAALIAVLLSSTAGSALAEFRYDMDGGGSVLFYGQFDPAFLYFDDGVESYRNLVDNVNSNSRFGLDFTQQYGENTFRFNFESAFGFRGSAGVSQLFKVDEFDWDRTNIRKVDFSLKTPMYGTFYVGQGSMATDGVAENDLSGTTLVTYSSISDTAGAYLFRTSAGALSTVAIGAVFSDLDSGRRGRIRYDTPSFAGFSLSAAYGEEILDPNINATFSDIALKYNETLGDFKVNAGIAYSYRDGDTFNQEDTFGSVSVLHSSGFNGTLATGSRDGGGKYGYVKLGYIGNWIGAGTTAISVDYYDGSDFLVAGSSSESFGIGAVQKIDRLNLEAYLGYRSYAYSQVGASFRDAESVLFGARFKF